MADHSSPLQSICYEHGALRLLDQRKLPLEIVYLDIKNAVDGWNAIRDMVVRGAPAIAISAALSLAVEVFHLDFTGTSSDAASFLMDKLEYLVSSRPTAVNLSDAATKLQNLALKAAETATEAKIVFQAYIDAAEHMLIDDVNSNKAIGFNGAIGIQAKLNDSKRISVLTHCNTGSLATAGYGTALGVIRTLHARGILEMAYCTETRPFNQAHPSLKHYKDKVIVNLGDLATLCGTDRANDANASTGVESTYDFDVEEIPEEDAASESSGRRKKKLKKSSTIDMIAEVVTHIAKNMDNPVEISPVGAHSRSRIETVYQALSVMTDLSEDDLIKAIYLLSADATKCEVFLVLPEIARRRWLRIHIGD